MNEQNLLATAKAIAVVLRGETLSVSKLRERAEVCDFESEEFFGLLQRLEDAGVISPFGSSRSRYTVDVNRLNELIARIENPQPPPEPEPVPSDGGAQAPEPAPEPAKDQATPPADGAQAPEPAPEPAKDQAAQQEQRPKVKLTRMEKILQKIASVPVTKLTAAERDMAVNEAFTKMTNHVVFANECITNLAEKTDLVSVDVDLLSIERIQPNGRGTGGARIRYSAGTGRSGAKILLDVPWDVNPTRKSLDRQVKKVEDATLGVINRMTEYVLKQSQQR